MHEGLRRVMACVSRGNDVNAANAAGETPMHGAAFRGVNAVVEFLVEKGARLDPRDMRGWTPFTIATGISYGDVFKQQPQTAKLLVRALGAGKPRVEPALAPGNAPEQVLAALADAPEDARIALVGHEPELGQLAAWLVFEKLSGLELGKAGVALVDLEARAPGKGRLVWLLQPRILRRLAR